MAGPVKIKAASDNLSNVVQGLQEMTDAELKNRTAFVLTTQYAGTTGVGSLQVGTSGAPANFTSIGTFTDRVHNSNVGDHPIVAGDTTDTTYTFSQGTASATDSKTARPLRSTGDEIEEMTDSEIDSEVIDACIKAMVDQDANTCGQYHISASAPSGGTWTSRGQIDDNQTDGTVATKYLYQKTAATTTPSLTTNRAIVKKADDNSFQEMSDSEIQALEGRFRNRIAANNIGKYEVSTSAPTGGGTWQQMGETLTDQVKDSASYNYAGSYSGSYSGNYTGSYSGTYAGSYSGNYQLLYSGSSGGFFTGSYTGYYTGSYSGTYTGSYSGSYTGYYAGLTLLTTSSTQESKKLFVRTA